jgi:NADH-quinone oxidoreductase subunit N
LTGGFFGKFLIFSTAFARGGVNWLLVAAILMSTVGIYYYFRVILAMYIREGKTETITLTTLQQATLILCLIFILVLGIMPNLVVGLMN